MALVGNISGSNQTSSLIGVTGSVIIANVPETIFPGLPGTDVTFFVSGSQGTDSDKSLFGGDLVVSGSGLFLGDLIEMTGSIIMSGTIDLDGVFKSGYKTFNVNDYTHTEGSATFAADVYSVITFVDTGLNEITVEDASLFAVGDRVAYVFNASNNNNQVHITEVTNSDNITIVTVVSAVSINGSSFNALSNAVSGGDSVLFNLSQRNEQKTYAHAEGSYTVASGLNSHAEGRKTAATGNHSHAEGAVSLATGLASHAEGQYTKATGDYSHAEGGYAEATGDYSHAGGDGGVASGYAAHAEGGSTVASGDYSHAEGQSTAAVGMWSHAEGNSSSANGDYSHAEGNGTDASGQSSHAEGELTGASGDQSHAEGYQTDAYSQASHAEGYQTFAGGRGYTVTSVVAGVITLDSSYGDVSGEFGTLLLLDDSFGTNVYTQRVFLIDTTTPGTPTVITLKDLSVSTAGARVAPSNTGFPTAAGADVEISRYSHSEGYLTHAHGMTSHAEGIETRAQGWGSHVEGYFSAANGESSHAEGGYTVAIGKYSHAEGDTSYSFGDASHAEGYSTFAGSYGYKSNSISAGVITLDSVYGDVSSQFSVGGYLNLDDFDDDDFYTHKAFKIASVTAATPTVITLEDVTVATNSAIIGPEGVNAPVGAFTIYGNRSHAEGNQTAAQGRDSHAEGYSSEAMGWASHAEGYSSIAAGNYSHAEGSGTTAGGESSHAEGNSTTASGDSSHAEGEGTTAAGYRSHAEGYQTFADNYASHAEGNQTKATGYASHAEGDISEATGDRTHAEGVSFARGNYSHSEGSFTVASGSASHSEGDITLAAGEASHAEGYQTVASGSYSHAAGWGTIASGSAQTAVGKYNLRDNDFSFFVVGNGTGDANNLRSDALRINIDSTQVTGSFFQRNSGSSTVGFMGDDTAALPIEKGTDVFFYVSGSSGSMGTATQGVAAFGGDVMITGSLKVGTTSIIIDTNSVQFGDASVRIEKAGGDLKFFDGSNTSGATLAALAAGGGGGEYTTMYIPDPSYWESTGIEAPVSATSVFRIGNKLYAFGARTSGLENKIYSASWTENPVFSDTGFSLPGNVIAGRSAIIGDKIFIFGDHFGAGQYIYSASISDPLTWGDSGVTLPQRRDNAPLVIANDRILLFKGYSGTAGYSTILSASVDDPLSFVETPSIGGAAWEASGWASDDAIYFAGGFNASTTLYRASTADTGSLNFSFQSIWPSTNGSAQVCHNGDELFMWGSVVQNPGKVFVVKSGMEAGTGGSSFWMERGDLHSSYADGYSHDSNWIGPDGRYYFIRNVVTTPRTIYRSGRKAVKVLTAVSASYPPYAALPGVTEYGVPASVSKHVRLGFAPWRTNRTGSF